MSDERLDKREPDDLLKRVLADDLPPDVAAGMRVRADRFRAGTMQDRNPAMAPGWLRPRQVLAALSVLMLVSGGLLQGLAARSPLADRISIVGAREAVLDGLEGAVAMTGSVRILNGPGGPAVCAFEWRAGGEPVLRPVGSGNLRDGAARIAAGLAAPRELRDLLAAEWRLSGFSGAAGRRTALFTIAAGSRSGTLVVEIDLDSRRPVALSRSAGTPAGSEAASGWEARFSFTDKRRMP